jgi:hypothetical protein
VQRLSANWKGILTTAIPIVVAILVFLPGHPRVRAAAGDSFDDDIIPVSYELPTQAKPSPFSTASVKRYHPAPRAAMPLPDLTPRIATSVPPGITFPSTTPE